MLKKLKKKIRKLFNTPIFGENSNTAQPASLAVHALRSQPFLGCPGKDSCKIETYLKWKAPTPTYIHVASQASFNA